MTKIKKGALIAFSEGCLSDYCYMGIFVALQDITDDDYQRAIAPEISKSRESKHYRQSKEAVVSNLIREGFLLELDYTEINIGKWGDIEPDAFESLATAPKGNPV